MRARMKHLRFESTDGATLSHLSRSEESSSLFVTVHGSSGPRVYRAEPDGYQSFTLRQDGTALRVHTFLTKGGHRGWGVTAAPGVAMPGWPIILEISPMSAEVALVVSCPTDTKTVCDSKSAKVGEGRGLQ